MLPPPSPTIAIERLSGQYAIGEGRASGMLYAAVLRGPKFYTRSGPPRQAIFIHGEELGANHSLLERPARWLIAKDLFDAVILPDRRGCGQSSILVRPLSVGEMAEDQRRLLDRLAGAGRMDPDAPLAALGLSMGGLVALALAGADPRVTCVGLLAGSPQRARPGLLLRLLLRAGLLDRWTAAHLRRTLGRRPTAQATFDPAYDARDPRAMTAVFDDALRAAAPERAESLRLDYAAGLDPAAARLPAGLRLDIPVLQVTGEGDELWETDLPAALRNRFPRWTRKTVAGAYLHKDVYLMAQAFIDALAEGIREVCAEMDAKQGDGTKDG